MNNRPDRERGHRPQFEKNKQKILATQEVCAICGRPVDMSLKSPHPMSASIDHIVPVSKGGHPSSIENLQLAHRCCNRAKSNKIVDGALVKTSDAAISNRVLPLTIDWLGYGKNN